MYSTRSVLFLSFLVGSSQARTLARLVTQGRSTYEGGWALGLPGSTCPADAPVACGTNDETVNPSCCPSGQTCFGLTTPHCCPSDTDCDSVVENFPTCANSTWLLYELNLSEQSYFCCEPGQIGVLPISGYAGLCEPSDQQVASSRIATLVGAAVTSSGSSAESTGSSESTLTSTLTNGAVKTITTAVPASTATTTTTSGVIGGYTPPPGAGNNSVYVTGLSTGAKIGLAIAFGVAVILVIAAIVWCYRRRRARRANFQAALLAGGYNPVNQGAQPPMQPPMQQQQQQQDQAPEYIHSPPQQYTSPVQEYKNPTIGVYPTGYAQTPSPPTPVQHQGGYIPPTPQYVGGPEPVEAPQAWERGVELGPGK